MSIVENGRQTNTTSNFQKEFGQATERNANQNASASNRNETPKAQLWVNIGIMTKAQNQEGEVVDHFVALPQGIPLDTMKKLEVKGTADYRARLTAQNDLLDQVIKRAESIAPGETAMFTFGATGLTVQIRRAKGEEAAIPADENQYSVGLGF